MFITTRILAQEFTFQLDNDYFAGTDQHFTSGLGISWLDDDYKENNSSMYSKALLNLLTMLPFKNYDSAQNYTAGLSLSQIMYTPVNLEKTTAQYNDIPYSGYLTLSFFVFQWNEHDFQEYRVDMGIVGPQSKASEIQHNFHILIRDPHIPQGWNTQLGPHNVLNMLYRYGQKSWQGKIQDSLNADWFNQIGIQAGNYMTDCFFSTAFRFGKNYSNNFNAHYPYLREEASLLKSYKWQAGFGWSFSTGVNADVTAYSYVLDEGRALGYDVKPYLLNNSAFAGIDLFYNAHRFSFYYSAQTPVAPAQKGVDFYGALMYNYTY